MIHNKIHLIVFFLFTFFSINTYAQYTLTNNDVVVVDGVIQSCSYNFAVTDIIIPETLDGQTVIGFVEGYWDYANTTFTGAFYQKGITSVQLPSTIEFIGNHTFSFNQLTSIDLSHCDNLTRIGGWAFSNNRLTSLDLSGCANLEVIDEEAFSWNYYISTLSLPNTLVAIRNLAFYKNDLTTLDVSTCSNLDTIGTGAFKSNEIVTVILNSNLKKIGDEAFYLNVITSVNLNNCSLLERIGDKAFYNNEINSVNFNYCTNLKSIGLSAFAGNNIPSADLTACGNLIQIGSGAFYDNTLTSFTLPVVTQPWFLYWSNSGTSDEYENGATVSDLLFEYNAVFEDVYTLTDEDVVVEDGYIISCEYIGSEIIIVPQELDNQTIIGIADAETSGGSVFRNLSMKEIILPTNIQYIGDYAFYKSFDGNLATISLPSSVQYIGDYTFYGNSITELNLTDHSKLKYLGKRAFYQNNLSNVNMGGCDSLLIIDTLTFGGNNLTEITIPQSVESIKDYAFWDNDLSTVNFEDNCHLYEIEKEAFNSNYGLSIILPAPVKEGYTFVNWKDTEYGFTYDAGDEISSLTSNITAQFEEDNTTTQNVTACDSYVSPSGKYTWISTGTYLDTLNSSLGEDSVIITNLTILHSTTSSIDRSACNTYTSPSGNHTWTSSGTYEDIIPNHVGCDSIITIHLTVNNTTYSTLNESACNTYTSPSEKYTWTTSGTYKDTIPNNVGCDSIITINLTINNPTSSSVNETACNNYLSPSENYTWTSSGVYKDTIQNFAGCDSIITINLTILNSTYSTITESAVDSYTSPSGNHIWTVSGSYKDTIPNSVGCDSIITINLTVTYTSSSTIVEDVCDSYDSPSGKYIWTNSGTYKDTIPNSEGADSVITIILTVNFSTNSNIILTACEDFLSPSGKYIWTSSGIYNDTIPNAAGCDSIMVVDLTREHSTSSSITAISCNSYTSPSENYVWTSSGTYKDTIENSVGCDSIITIDLTINSLDDIEIISQNGSYEIIEDGGSLTFSMQTTPIDSECETAWLIEGDTHLASFSEGVLTACGCGEGEIILRAYSVDNPDIYDEKTISISNQISGLITNSTFDNNINNWFLWTPECNNSVIWDNGEAKIIFGDNGEQCWSQFMTNDYMTVEEGKTYQVSFDAYSSVEKSALCVIRYNGEDYHAISPEKEFQLGTEKQSFGFIFTMSEPTCNIAQIHFNIAGNNESVWIDNVGICELKQTNVTFQVNMQNEEVTSGVSLLGSWDEWTNPIVMSGNENIYSVTAPMGSNSSIEYKFVNSSSATDYANYEVITDDCTSSEGNRYLTVPDEDTVLNVVCFGSCEECPIPKLSIAEIQGNTDVSPFNNFMVETEGEVTFIDDYGCFIQDASNTYSGIYIYHSAFSSLSVGDGLRLKGKVSEYNGLTEIKDITWSETFASTYNIYPIEIEQEDLSEKYESVLVKAVSVEAVEENEYSDWLVSFSNDIQILIDDKYYSHELSAGKSYHISGIVYYRYNAFALNPRFEDDIVELHDVTFQVDMQHEEISETGVYLNGNFINWSTSNMPEMDAVGSVYSTKIKLEAGDSIEYKYINGFSENWAGYETVIGNCTFSDQGNRLLVVPESDTVLNVVCFGSCDICSEETGINSFIKGGIKIYPNPADDIVYIDLNKHENSKIILIDILGKVIHQKTSSSSIEFIRLESYQSGIYFLIVDNGITTNNFKLIIK